MLIHVRSDQAAAAALREPPTLCNGRLTGGFKHLLTMKRSGWLRFLLAAAACFGVAAFMLGVGNRLTRGPWYLYPPVVSPIPPIGAEAWQQAFVLHQQSPLYALCGGYDVGGMESIVIFRFLYWWEWLRIASVVLLALSLFAAVNVYLRGVMKSARGSDLRSYLLPGIGLLAAIVGYFVLGYFADHAGLFATINLGQHRHALDVTFASIGLGMLIAACCVPKQAAAGTANPRVAWATVIALNIGFGALIEALDAGPLWTSFPGYTGSLLPTSDRLFAFHPVWRNLTENGYLVQAVHRILSIGLWAAALIAVVRAWLRRQPCLRRLLLFGLLTLEGALGVAVLQMQRPVVPSIVHQILAIAVLAVALVPDASNRRPANGPTLPSVCV